MKALIEERGGALIEKAFGVDAEHVIRFDKCFGKTCSDSPHIYKCTIKVVSED